MTNICPHITVEQFLSYKSVNQDILESAQLYIDKIIQEKKTFKPYSSASKRGRGNYWLNKARNNQGQGEDDMLYTRFRSTLNKVTEQNVKMVAQEMLDMPIKTQEHLINLINFIFEKVKSESKFANTYAALVTFLYYLKVTDDNGTEHSFNKLFHNKCKKMFDTCISYNVELEQQYTSIETNIGQTEFNFKDQVISCINFIATLYNFKILNNDIVNSCLTSIFNAVAANKAYSVHILVSFIKIISKRYHENATKIVELYNQLEALENTKTMSVRDKIYISDTLAYLNQLYRIK